MRYFLSLTVLATIALAGCNRSASNNGSLANANSRPSESSPAVIAPPPPLRPSTPVDPGYKSCNPYYPLVPGSLVKHTIFYSSGLVADVTTVVELSDENGRKVLVEKEQIVDTSGGSKKLSTAVRTHVCEGNNVQIVSERGEDKVEGLQNSFETKFSNQAFVMVAPADLIPGRSWSYSLTRTLRTPNAPPVSLDPITRSLEYNGVEEVQVPAGKFKAVKIKWLIKERSGTDYYARGIGLVKRIAQDGTRWELKEYGGIRYLD